MLRKKLKDLTMVLFYVRIDNREVKRDEDTGAGTRF